MCAVSAAQCFGFLRMDHARVKRDAPTVVALLETVRAFARMRFGDRT
jgi:hypothetical protein